MPGWFVIGRTAVLHYESMRKNLWWWLVGGFGGLFVFVIGGLQWWKYFHFGYNGLDLGIYSQVVWSLAHGHGFASSIHDPSYLGDHLEPWLIPISWLYRLWGSPLLLLWIQTLVLGSAVIPLAKIARRLAGERASIVAAGLFVAHPLLYNIALYEFHELAFMVPLLLWSIWYYLQDRWKSWFVLLLAIVITREDAPFVVAGWGIMALIDRRSWRWWAPAFGLAIAWFPVAQTIIRHANHDGVYKYLTFYRWLGETPLEILTFPFRHPLVFLTNIVTVNNLGTVVGLAATVGFLCFVRPRRLWPLVFLGAQLLIGNAQPGTYLRIHYTAPFLPFLLWAALDAFRAHQRGKIFVKLPTLARQTFVPILAIVAPLYSTLIIGPAEWPWQTNRLSSTPTEPLRAAIATIHSDDRVLSSFSTLPQLANRVGLYSLNYLYLGRRQYSDIPYKLPTDIDVAFIDWQQLYEYQYLYRDTVFQDRSGPQRIQAALADNHLYLAEQFGTVSVYRRNGSSDQSAVRIDKPAGQPTTLDAVTLYGQPTVVETASAVPHYRTFVLTADWSVADPKQDKYFSLNISFTQNSKAVWKTSQLLGQGPIPSSEWGKDEVWRTQQKLLVPDTVRGSSAIKLTVVTRSGRYRLDRLRTFRPILDQQQTLGTITLGTDSLSTN